jgi:Fe-S cluster assembly ATP-binding protein
VDVTLSGGERKRIELASIVAMRPKVVLMDEPDSGVDIEAINSIFEVLRKLKERGTTVIMITHSAEVLKQADHAFLLCNGCLVEKGSVGKLENYFAGNCVPCDHKNEPVGREITVNE